jgi:DnaJ-class molecular chaperone
MGDYVCGNPECRKLYLASGLHFVVLPPLCKDCGGSGYDPDWTKAGHEGMCHGCQGMGVEVEDDLL